MVTAIITLSIAAFDGLNSQWGDIKITHIKGIKDIKWGIDTCGGGVNVILKPEKNTKYDKMDVNMAEQIIKQRLFDQDITDNEIYTNYKKGDIIVRFPWVQNGKNLDSREIINELTAKGELVFCEETLTNEDKKLKKNVPSKAILTNTDIEEAFLDYDEAEPIVSLKFNEDGTKKFKEAIQRLAKNQGKISIWMDNKCISEVTTQDEKSFDGEVQITGLKDIEEAKKLVNKINEGALPFKLTADNYSIFSPKLGKNIQKAVIITGIVVFSLISLFMIVRYRILGIVYIICLLGQMSFIISTVTGFFPFFSGIALTLPGITGIVLSIGISVNAWIIMSEKVKEEIITGKTVKGAVNIGISKGASAAFINNIVVLIVAIVLIGAFGPPSNLFVKLFAPIFMYFGSATAGAVYSFGYTLMAGTLANILFNIFAAKTMLKSLVKFKAFKKRKYLWGLNKNYEKSSL